MKKAGFNARLHESLGAKHPGPHKQSLKSRSHESESMEKKHGHGKYAAVHSMDAHEHMKEAMKHLRHAHKKHKAK